MPFFPFTFAMFGGCVILLHCHITFTRTASQSPNTKQQQKQYQLLNTFLQETQLLQLSRDAISHSISLASTQVSNFIHSILYEHMCFRFIDSVSRMQNIIFVMFHFKTANILNWLRHYDTSKKVAGSRADEVN
jgi:hypothetical protein